MAEALLGVVLGNLNTLVQKELATFWGVDGEIERLSNTLSAIRAVVADAEVRQTTEHSLKHWIQKLTDATYMLDDILDECSMTSTRSKCEGDDSRSANEDHNVSLSSCDPKTMFFRYKVVKRIKAISQRIDHSCNQLLK